MLAANLEAHLPRDLITCVDTFGEDNLSKEAYDAIYDALSSKWEKVLQDSERINNDARKLVYQAKVFNLMHRMSKRKGEDPPFDSDDHDAVLKKALVSLQDTSISSYDGP